MNLKQLIKIRKHCENCGSTKELSRHHIIHKSDGGTDSAKNLRLLCSYCHKKVHGWAGGRGRKRKKMKWKARGIVFEMDGKPVWKPIRKFERPTWLSEYHQERG